jgi:hypothetical protein
MAPLPTRSFPNRRCCRGKFVFCNHLAHLALLSALLSLFSLSTRAQDPVPDVIGGVCVANCEGGSTVTWQISHRQVRGRFKILFMLKTPLEQSNRRISDGTPI